MKRIKSRRTHNSWTSIAVLLSVAAIGIVLYSFAGTHKSTAQAKKPNILVIFGDDIGVTNVSAYGHGLVGYRTPNIDRIALQAIPAKPAACFVHDRSSNGEAEAGIQQVIKPLETLHGSA